MPERRFPLGALPSNEGAAGARRGGGLKNVAEVEAGRRADTRYRSHTCRRRRGRQQGRRRRPPSRPPSDLCCISWLAHVMTLRSEIILQALLSHRPRLCGISTAETRNADIPFCFCATPSPVAPRLVFVRTRPKCPCAVLIDLSIPSAMSNSQIPRRQAPTAGPRCIGRRPRPAHDAWPGPLLRPLGHGERSRQRQRPPPWLGRRRALRCRAGSATHLGVRPRETPRTQGARPRRLPRGRGSP